MSKAPSSHVARVRAYAWDMSKAPSSHAARVRADVARLVNTVGVAAAARELQISRESVVRIVAGLDVRKGTLEVVARRLYEMAARAVAPGGAKR